MHRFNSKSARQWLLIIGIQFFPVADCFSQPVTLVPIRISADRRGFVLGTTEQPFVPWGFNYDHDSKGRLIEDYWESEWASVEADFQEMKQLGANVVRIHLQLGKFMNGPAEPNVLQLGRLEKLLKLAEQSQLYLDLTGLGCYHKNDVPAWYDQLDEQGRWDVQARFWQAIASRAGKSPSVFCYDLMNEPVVPGGRRAAKDWLGPAFAGKHFVQFITLDQADRPRPEVAQKWIHHLVHAIRAVDQKHLITVGMVDWSLDRPGLTSGFLPGKVTTELDFLCVHLYPENGKLEAALNTLAGFDIGKPLVIEETFPLKCSTREMRDFVEKSKKHATGWISFYWGQPIGELKKSKQLGDGLLAEWLEEFQKLSPVASR
jgi:hypothetical protein